MANQNLIDRLNLEREITDLQKERANINKQAKADMKDRANLLDNIVSSARNNKKLAIAQKDLEKQAADPAFIVHLIRETESNDPKENTKSASDISDVTTPDELKN